MVFDLKLNTVLLSKFDIEFETPYGTDFVSKGTPGVVINVGKSTFDVKFNTGVIWSDIKVNQFSEIFALTVSDVCACPYCLSSDVKQTSVKAESLQHTDSYGCSEILYSCNSCGQKFRTLLEFAYRPLNFVCMSD